MEKASEEFNLGEAIEEALQAITISQREILEEKELHGFAFYAKGIKPGHHQWLADFSEYIHKEGGNNPASIKSVVKDYLEREVKALQKKLSTITDNGEREEQTKLLEAKQRFLEKLLEALGGHKSETAKNEKNDGSANQLFNKENLKGNAEKTLTNIINQVKWLVGGVLGIKSWQQPWNDYRAQKRAAREEDAKRTVQELRGKYGKSAEKPKPAIAEASPSVPVTPSQSSAHAANDEGGNAVSPSIANLPTASSSAGANEPKIKKAA